MRRERGERRTESGQVVWLLFDILNTGHKKNFKKHMQEEVRQTEVK